MSSLGSPSTLFLAKKKAYEVERSLRFVNDNSAYLDRTPSSAGNRRTMTLSLWVKGMFGFTYQIFDAHQNDSNRSRVFLADDGTIQFFHRPGDTTCTTSAKFRDPSAWYHIVFAFDTTQSSVSDRYKIYINGVEQATNNNVPAQNTDLFFNSTNSHKIGVGGDDQGNENYFQGYMAEINFIDGQQYDPSYFGETNVLTGQWIPKKYVGGYGTNGFYLNFNDNSGTSATTLGKDESGNGNNYTPNNFSVASGLGNDSFEDTPTNNFPTLNPNHAFLNGSSSYASEANLQWNGVNNNQAGCPASMAFPTTGKWYWEVKLLTNNANFSFGITPATYSNTTNPSSPTGSIGYAAYGSKIVSGSETASWAASFSNSDNIGAALDMDNNEIKFYKNNSLVGTISLVSGYENVEYLAWIKGDTASTTIRSAINFGGNGFVYTPPTGFKALNSANLPDPTILLPNKHFDTLLYTGNGGTQSITGLNFAPDWVWIKKRNNSGSTNHNAFDSVRGATKYLTPNTTGAEATDADSLTSFDSNGFTLGDYNLGNLNSSSLVSWNWNVGDTDGKTYAVTVVDDSGNKYRFDGFGTSAVTLDLAEGGTYVFDQSDSSNATHPLRFYTAADKTGGEYTTGVTTSGTAGSSGATVTITIAASAPTLYYQCSSHAGMGGQINTNSTLGSSNFDGSVQSLVKANPTAGISITRYTGTGSSITVGHGLGVTPQVTMTKKLTGTGNWTFLHTVYDGSYDRLYLNSGAAYANSAITPPTSTVFSRVASDVNNSGMICYCFSSVEGYSKIGFYRGNGSSSDGTFVYCGFRPAWIMIKGRTGTRNWFIKDIKRDTYNLTTNSLFPNTNGAESTSGAYDLDILSNGFKIRTNNSQSNQNNIVYIFMAYAESPFKNARAR